ncbi:MAG: plastocyanin/azurin family copper-binding protein [Pirellulaceae bacterium]
MKLTIFFACCLFCVTGLLRLSSADEAKPPRVFLDKSERVVLFQLNRLSNEQLLLVPRETNDPKYKPVFATILTRPGISRQHREEAVRGLSILNASDPVAELLTAISTLDALNLQQRAIGEQLAAMLLSQSEQDLKAHHASLVETVESSSPLARAVGFAGLMAAGELDNAWVLASKSEQATIDCLTAIKLLPDVQRRNQQRERVLQFLSGSAADDVKLAAIGALSKISSDRPDTFVRVSQFLNNKQLASEAVATLLAIPRKERDASKAAEIVQTLLRQAEATPAAKRTSPSFLNAMQLVDQLIGTMPVDDARRVRDRLAEITVRVVQIRTIEEEMRYDTPYFAVEAGRDVQIVLVNEDLMPHNLVITTPGSLKEVAELGSAMSSEPGASGKMHVPDSPKVLFATSMVQAHQREALTFTAPTEPGEYPFVCTFPRHWMRMYGVMVVVEDLDAWLKNPVEPKDPIGSNRAFVQSWRLDDFKDDLEKSLQGRSPEIGRRIFEEASCAQCHKVRGEGGAVGPELADVLSRWKGDKLAVLQEVLDPSHKIDPKYVVHVLLTVDGKAVSGIVVAEDKKTVSILANPESPEPMVVDRDDIEVMNQSSQSMMPKALLDRFTKDEIYELMSYLLAEQT